MKISRAFVRSFLIGIGVIAVIVIYAYGFQVTRVSLAEVQSPRRQESIVRVMRALARPLIFEYERDEFAVETPIWVPCPPEGLDLFDPDLAEPYMVVEPQCAGPRQYIRVEGHNFEPNTQGPLFFIPPVDPAIGEVTLSLGQITTDSRGNFSIEVRLPNRPNEQPQTLRALTRRDVGSPMLTRTARDTWDRIIETIFMALLATTLGTIVAIPISFFAARNLMKDVTITVIGLAFALLAWLTGIYLGWKLAGSIGQISQSMVQYPVVNLAGVLGGALLVFGAVRVGLPQEDEQPPTQTTRMVRMVLLAAAGIAAVFAMFMLAQLLDATGRAFAPRLGGLSFLGSFLRSLGEILNILIASITALGGGALLGSLATKSGKALDDRLTPAARLPVNLALGALSGAVIALLAAAGLNWLYQYNNPAVTLYWPAGIGAVLGVAAALWARRFDALPIGLGVYYIARLILNALRSIEALLMAIVFAVWVGIGPFAGVLALSLHTIASQAKLFSEQVESILPGPLEAIKATGATRLQTVVYAVIPQIIPPYISFTMYRWDINVRMSTIIGFAGGGGIGFLLQQNIGLLNYRAASVQMLAIAIVVSLMDYLSSYMREKVV